MRLRDNHDSALPCIDACLFRRAVSVCMCNHQLTATDMSQSSI